MFGETHLTLLAGSWRWRRSRSRSWRGCCRRSCSPFPPRTSPREYKPWPASNPYHHEHLKQRENHIILSLREHIRQKWELWENNSSKYWQMNSPLIHLRLCAFRGDVFKFLCLIESTEVVSERAFIRWCFISHPLSHYDLH